MNIRLNSLVDLVEEMIGLVKSNRERIKSLEAEPGVDPALLMSDEEMYELTGIKHIPFEVPEKKK